MMHSLAQELNAALKGSVPGSFLSDLGERIYFPHGIIAQGADAKKRAKTANATIGMMTQGGKPAILPEIAEELPRLSAAEIVAYAPTAGNQELRELWKQSIVAKNPALQHTQFSLPVAVSGITAGLSLLCDLFLSEGDALLAGGPAWDNYELISAARRNAAFKPFNMLADGGIDFGSFQEALQREEAKGAVRLLLNFPHNPSGYSPTVAEARTICALLKEGAEKGCRFLVICDDAYFGLAFEDDVERQSLFAYLADMHENIFAAKLDGPTKEDFVWGFRCGFLTFAGKGVTGAQYDALTQKLMGLIRSSVSCSATPSQSLLLKAYGKPRAEEHRARFRAELAERYRKIRAIVAARTDCAALEALPFNSGYFMSFRCADAEALRLRLLEESGIGTVAIDGHTLRIAFSSVDADQIDAVYAAVYRTAEALPVLRTGKDRVP
ncbi:aminotransferase class I/II-fold pyridoxal phosphate-dependent enzyme [Treponema endosymbiont of Eucomonympha sp.]|uniref:aminotransferase class I/II-fold pyridoxal phosphate-dependent enzyme n=1 Tax=Treponema endosymbiont of Eucomonympha sp. TaxID=1580831 RepID=UPI000781A357|nr:aminotransferase class I/II-fold pyridoxal phosphate-dependent enzyme [Treponema endosymbiont of Eucomonympha sp.]